MSSKTISEKLSTLVSDTSIPQHLQDYLLKAGIRYIGEIFRMASDKRGSKAMKIYAELYRILNEEFALTEHVNLQLWRPPYWDDPSFRLSLNTCIDRTLKRRKRLSISLFPMRQETDPYNRDWYITNMHRMYHNMGIHYFGQWLRTSENCTALQLSGRQSLINPKSRLWAGAILPPDWIAPTDVPEEWNYELGLIKAEMDAAYRRAELRQK